MRENAETDSNWGISQGNYSESKADITWGNVTTQMGHLNITEKCSARTASAESGQGLFGGDAHSNAIDMNFDQYRSVNNSLMDISVEKPCDLDINGQSNSKNLNLGKERKSENFSVNISKTKPGTGNGKASSWCQNMMEEWYRTVDLDYRADNVPCILHYNYAVTCDAYAYLDTLLMRIGKTKLLMELLKSGSVKLRNPVWNDFFLCGTHVAACLKEKECLQILLEDKKVMWYNVGWCIAACMRYFSSGNCDTEIFTLLLKIYKRALKEQCKPHIRFEFLYNLLCQCIENDRFSFAEQVIPVAKKFRNKAGQVQVTYEAVRQLVWSNRPDVLQILMKFGSFPGCLEEAMLYSVLCGE